MEQKFNEKEMLEKLRALQVRKNQTPLVETPSEPLVYEKDTPVIVSEEKIPLQDKIFVKPLMTISELMGKERPNEDEAFVIIQDGGVGDAICATPMIESAKKFYPDKKIIVGSSHHEVLINNPHIDHLYNLGFPMDLFDKWVKPLKHFGSVIKRDIYNASAHKLFPGPLSMIWCHLYGVPFEGDDVKIYLSEQEEAEGKWFLGTFPRPVVLIHPTGAKLTFNPSVQITPNKDWFKEHWTAVVSYLTKKYDVVQVGGKNEEEIPGVTTYLMGQTSLRQTAALLKHCLTYISIDSFVGHCGPAVGKPGVVVFGRSNPYIAGHAMNKNIFVKDSCEFNDLHCGRPQGYFGDSEMFKGQMRPWVCPHRSCMQAIKPEMVIEAFNEIVKDQDKK